MPKPDVNVQTPATFLPKACLADINRHLSSRRDGLNPMDTLHVPLGGLGQDPPFPTLPESDDRNSWNPTQLP
jgi:hypothetical protein